MAEARRHRWLGSLSRWSVACQEGKDKHKQNIWHASGYVLAREAPRSEPPPPEHFLEEFRGRCQALFTLCSKCVYFFELLLGDR